MYSMKELVSTIVDFDPSVIIIDLRIASTNYFQNSLMSEFDPKSCITYKQGGKFFES